MNLLLKVILAVLAFWGAKIPVKELEKTASYEALGEIRTMRVEYAAGKEAWADYVLAKSREFLVATTLYLGKPVPKTSTLLIRGRDQVLFELPGFPWSGQPIGGSNYGDRIEITYSLSEPGKPALLYHELGHYWFGSSNNDSSVNWLYEGIVSYLPLALKAANLLSIDETTMYWIEAHWQDSGDKDAPLELDIRSDPKDASFALFYAKSYRVQKLLYYYLGAAGYKQFLESLSPNKGTTNTEIIGLFGAIKKLDWKALLSGWVFGQTYGAISKDALSDIDADGLTGLEERAAETDPLRADTDNDGLSDGVELELSLDPLAPIDPALRKYYITKAGIRIDGLGSDWEGRGRVWITDPMSDVKASSAVSAYNPGSFDIIKVEIASRGDFIHILVSTKNLPDRKRHV